MLRTLFRMAEETAAKRLKTSPPMIGTHKYGFSILFWLTPPALLTHSTPVVTFTPMKPSPFTSFGFCLHILHLF